ncbi:BTAD domain-containing putative transcriptional regulator [Micromonospora sp. NPDC047465]|uniref:AfsR/SARP family transcriptional regulator n=1 Tax=Micromonospora sp. NPDC047465 TaxID=3154813 RepID=UPI0033E1046E
MTMRWCVLGPVEVSVAGRALPIDRPQHRALLALLMLNAGRLVSPGQLIEALWAADPPVSARTQVQVCVSRIRAALRAADLSGALVTHSGGYRLLVDDGALDLAEFTVLLRQARAAEAAGQLAEAARLLRAGLALWRGPALAGAAGAFVEAAAAGLDEQRLLAQEQLAAVELALGGHETVARTLRPLVDAHPLRERLVAHYLVALAGSGCQADALRVYADTRRRLVEDLGVEPAAELAETYLRVLRQEVTGPEPARGGGVPAGKPAEPGVRSAGPPVGSTPAPAQLPADLAGFTGRAGALRELDALLPEDADTPTDAGTNRTVVICTISGTAGVGKTTTAVHWAHRVAHRFPDGQLYVNLRGFDLAGRAVSSGEALRGFLEALHVSPQRMPSDPTQQAALFRTTVAGRRMLVLLDNARDADQVRPLLPGTSGCLVVVTSRNQLTGLTVTDGAHPVSLDLLAPDEARALLERRLGRDRCQAEPVAVEAIVGRCARLPLALAIVAARAATAPDLPLGTLAAELAATRVGDLSAFDAGDPATDVRLVFSWSYQALDAGSARLFRRLGLHPGPDVGQPAAASLAGVSLSQVRPLLAGLTRANLLTERSPGRYATHDLLRAYAAQLCDEVDSTADREAARHRLFDHYLHTTHAADELFYPYRLACPVTLPPARAGVTVSTGSDHIWAVDWFTGEHQVLLATVAQAAAEGFDTHVWSLATVLTTYLDRRGHWDDLSAVQQTALAAARRAADLFGQAQAHHGLAIAYTWLERHSDAHRHYRDTLALYRRLGDDAGQAHAHLGISWVLARQGRHDAALDPTRQALDLYRSAGHLPGQAKALNNLGWSYAQRGDHEAALPHLREALRLNEETDDRRGAAMIWDSLGFAQHGRGEHLRALDCYHRALRLHRELGDRYDEADVLDKLGDTHQAAGDLAAARTAWRDAAAIFDELDLPDAERPRGKLAGIADG